jgi:hypothetical protein
VRTLTIKHGKLSRDEVRHGRDNGAWYGRVINIVKLPLAGVH